MIKYHFYTILGTILFPFLLLSCSSDLDFNQVNDLRLEPVIVANLTYFDIAARQFVENGVEENLLFDAQDFDVFRDSFLRNNLKRTDFSFQITNTINRAYSFDLNLIDQNDDVIYTIRMDVPASNGTAVIIDKTEIFENAKLELLKASRRLEFVLVMAPGPALSENSLGSLKLKSSATVYLVIE
jgi:hypothetical protein